MQNACQTIGRAERRLVQDLEFTTARLLVRSWRASDLDALLAVYGDVDAMRWVGDGKPLTVEQCVKWFEVTRSNYEKYGYGMFATEHRAIAGVIGFCGIVHPRGQAEPEVKYAYQRQYWGRGFATEALVGLLKYASEVHGLRSIIATTAPANTSSHRVLLKAGMQRGMLRESEDGSRTQLFDWQPG